MDIAKKIKQENKPSLKELFLCSYIISQRISPYVSSFYIKRNIIPNKITLHMIYSGIIGAILFSLPNMYAKILGAIFIHLWFILDCSDGEVARYTKVFSLYGKELDYMAHLINHPLFGISIFISMSQLNRYNLYFLFIIVLCSNFMDCIVRNLLTLNIVYNLKREKSNLKERNELKWDKRRVILFLTSIFTLYPNLILFGVLIYFIDYYLGTNILYIYLVFNVLLTFMFAVKDLIFMTFNFYRNE